MRRVVIAFAVVCVVAPAGALAVEAPPIPHSAVLAIDRKVVYRNFLPTRPIQGFTYYRWSYKSNVLRVDFRNQAGKTIEWRVEPMTGTCSNGMQKSYQLGGNKVWWAQSASEQSAWRCVFDQAGKELRLEAATALPPTKWAPTGLGAVAAHAKRY